MTMHQLTKTFCLAFSFIWVSFLSDHTAQASNLMTVTPGDQGQMQPRQLYSVEIVCPRKETRPNKSALRDMVDAIHSRLFASDGVVNHNISIKSSSVLNAATLAASTSQSAGNPRPEIFGFPVYTATSRHFRSEKFEQHRQRCGQQFFVTGDSEYTIDARLGYQSGDAGFLSKLAAAAAAATKIAGNLWVLYAAKATPADATEFGNNVSAGKALIEDFLAFRQLFGYEDKAEQVEAGTSLRVGTNTIATHSKSKTQVHSTKLLVRAVESLVDDDHTHFLSNHRASASSSANFNFANKSSQEIRNLCLARQNEYHKVGIIDPRDHAFLLRARLIDSNIFDKKQSFDCLGRKLSLSLLGLIDRNSSVAKSLTVVEDLQLTRRDFRDHGFRVLDPNQPHGDNHLNSKMGYLSELLGKSIQSNGLLGDEAQQLANRFSGKVTISDETFDYWMLKELSNDENERKKAKMERDLSGLMDILREKGFHRVGCVQRANRKYNSPVHDSAIMLLMFEAMREQLLDPSKQRYVGVHVYFERTSDGEYLINRLVFEERFKRRIADDCRAREPERFVNASKPSV